MTYISESNPLCYSDTTSQAEVESLRQEWQKGLNSGASEKFDIDAIKQEARTQFEGQLQANDNKD